MRLVAESVNATFHVSGQLKATEIFYRKEGIKGDGCELMMLLSVRNL